MTQPKTRPIILRPEEVIAALEMEAYIDEPTTLGFEGADDKDAWIRVDRTGNTIRFDCSCHPRLSVEEATRLAERVLFWCREIRS